MMERVPVRRVIFGTSIKGPTVAQPGKVNIHPQIASLLARPSWSVRSMLPASEEKKQASVSKTQLHHLLKLSALPQPKSQEQENAMLETLESQIHFVKEVQKVDTKGVEPLVAIRDETAEAVQEQTVTLESLQPYLDMEERVGNNGTIRRPRPTEMIKDSGWDPFEAGAGSDSRKKGKYFFVKKRKDGESMVAKPVPRGPTLAMVSTSSYEPGSAS